ncbi:hypothetical protein CAI21_04275 [Alkalilimnicola ehrlichii]|uniref:PilZ domain-containing protein n=1 Tax=Alkalilimnicola ehrlichii TaxID=351052 RepID=A0A3E0X1F6_9GAMM|nr:PilZ domain-containing protein [Alkalilimnicola ehrlichii]RFA30731.1 hypothetical protein CAI21_04275 [Alkalilimnicola ehrlichii]RFA38307.1 hypothetical protein CAL65_05640 [Alkalilimnicola ehrlichii]
MRRERRFSNVHVHKIKVSNSLNGKPLGVIRDLSSKGIGLVGKQPFASGACYAMRLHIADNDGHTEHVDVKMICRWIKKNPSRPVYQAGFELDQPSQEFVDFVEDILARGRTAAKRR